MIYAFYYIVIGLIFSLVYWIFFVSNNVKQRVSCCIYFPIAIVTWPLIMLSRLYFVIFK